MQLTCVINLVEEGLQLMGNFWRDLSQHMDKTAKQAEHQIHQAVNQGEKETDQSTSFDAKNLSEADRKAFAGALFAIAAADGAFDREEFGLIFETLMLDGLSDAARQEIQGYLIQPPRLEVVLDQLATADATLRYGLMVLLVDIAWADDLLTPEEEFGLWVAQEKLGVTDEQRQAIHAFIQKLRQVRARGLNDDYAADAVKNAAAGLSAVGVPIAAVYFSGSVVGLSAAGITSGLAALGMSGLLGLSAMVTGIGIIAVVGAGIYMGASYLFDTGGKQAKERYRAEQERKAQLVIANLQAMIDGLMQQLRTLQNDVTANRETIDILFDRVRKLKGLLNQRRAVVEVTE